MVGIDDQRGRSECFLKPNRGPCKGNLKRYYYDELSNECKEFSWGGCAGVAPFETKEECEQCKNSVNLQETALHRDVVGGNHRKRGAADRRRRGCERPGHQSSYAAALGRP